MIGELVWAGLRAVRVAKKPYHTGRCASAEFGPPPGAVYAAELAGYSDMELIRRDRAGLLAVAEAERTVSRARQVSSV